MTEEESKPSDQTFGSLADFMKVPLPVLEEGALITDIAALVFYQGEDGEDFAMVWNPGMSSLALDGALSRVWRYGITTDDDYEPPEEDEFA